MKKKTIIRCGSEAITVGICDVVSNSPKFNQVLCLQLNQKTDLIEDWLNALNTALGKIPLAIRNSAEVVIPPNDEIFIKLIHTTDPKLKSYKETLQFEFNHAFRGGVNEWVYDSFKPNKDSEDAFCFAMHRSFIEKFLDCLLRNHVNFNYLCPEHLLNNLTIRNLKKYDMLSLNIGKSVSAATFVGKNFTHVKNINVGGNWINSKLIEAANISNDEAEQKKIALSLTNTQKKSEDSSFIEYYLTQFAQKFHSEVKNAEMYYCGRFGEAPIKSILLSGNGGKFSQLNDVFINSSNIKVVRDIDLMCNCLDANLSAQEISQIEPYLCSFYGAGLCIIDQENAVNLFSEDLQDQLIFQKNLPKFMFLVIGLTMFLLFMSNFMQRGLTSFSVEKQELLKKNLQADQNCKNYTDLLRSYNEINDAIKQSKFVYDNQAEWINIFAALQNALTEAKNVWIDKFDWVDFSSRSSFNNISSAGNVANRQVIAITLKQFFEPGVYNDEEKNKIVDAWVNKLKSQYFVSSIENVQLKHETNDLLKISFEIILKNNVGVLANE